MTACACQPSVSPGTRRVRWPAPERPWSTRRSSDGTPGSASSTAPWLTLHSHLDDDQRNLVPRLTTSGGGVEVIVGKAGAGKTTALAAARAAWQASGHTVLGGALAARAAAELNGAPGSHRCRSIASAASSPATELRGEP